MKHPPPNQVFGPAINRIDDLMAHSSTLAFGGVQRLAQFAGVSPASISRIICGLQNPTFLMVARITAVLEEDFGRRIDPRDLVAENGQFLTRFACDLVGCRGCYPDAATDQFGYQSPAYEGVNKGQWVTSKYPKGYINQKGA
jgi:transcriptional regulator with XRE-family HTH domain